MTTRDWKNTPVLKRWIAIRKIEGAPLRAAVDRELSGLRAALLSGIVLTLSVRQEFETNGRDTR